MNCTLFCYYNIISCLSYFLLSFYSSSYCVLWC